MTYNNRIVDYTRKAFSPLLSRNATFTGLLVLIFLCIGLVNTLNHEMWRDELQAWLIAKESSSVAELFNNTRYEGHPRLWFICLYVLSRFTDQPIVMQLFHLLLAIGTIYVFTRFSPFTKLQKILFVFGYFPLYEYATISRNYGMGILLTFCFCAMLQSGVRNYLVLSCILFLLAQTNLCALLIAISLGFMLLFECVTDRNLRKSLSARRMEIAVSISIFILGVVSSIFQLILPADAWLHPSWRTNIDICQISRVIATVCGSYIVTEPIILPYKLFILPCAAYKAGLSIILLYFSLSLFVRKPAVFFLYCFGTLGLLAFSYTKYIGFLRHHGHLFILLIVCLWISEYYPNIELKSRTLNGLSSFCKEYRSRFIVVILSIHLLAGIVASGRDWLYPYSAGKEVAKFINDKQMNNMLMLGNLDYAASTVAGYLNRKIYYPRGNRFGTFIIWDKKRGNIPTRQVLKKAKELTAQRKEDILLIMNYELNIPTIYPIVKIREFKKSIRADERYYLYLMSYDDITTAD